ncbi:S9 family peptidase [Novosphingobium terrae]|uniref:S9 family peptidase n=1 Tax=Novosphingobium terrae TaxID=2726189 RepID=UPI00197E0E83|nr:S9 family peptidase [Novosphingobium terrae]
MRLPACVLLAATMLASPALSQTASEHIHTYDALALAPKGDRLAAVEPAGKDHSAIVLRAAADGHVLTTLDPCGTCTYAGLGFSMDGALAFVARDRAKGISSLMLAQDGQLRTLATIAGLAATPRFSPDGKRVALLVTIGASKETGATQAGARQVGEIGDKSDEQRLALFDRNATLSSADVKPLTPADRYIYEYDWAPDGRSLVVTSAVGNGDNNWWVATLDAVDAATGAQRTIAKPTTQINMPRVSPDGKTVAFIGGVMSDFGSIGGDVWTVALAGGTPVNRTAGDKATVNSLDWTMGGLRGTRLAGDSAQLVSWGASGPARVLWNAPVSLGAGDGRAVWSADGTRVASVQQDFTHGPAILAGTATAPRLLTHDNDSLPAVTRARSVTWTNDGFTVQGWVLAPLTAENAAKAPMVTIVHGGPAAANEPRYVQKGTVADLLAKGYYIFYPNPRGSYGQGEAFTAANRRDFGGGDLRDILTGIDAVEKIAPVDDSRLGLTGGSYGGFMSMWANTQTNRFKAIVAAAGLSNWISYYGTNGIDQWMLPFFGKTMYDDPAAYRAASAIDFIKQAKTPTFIYVGERDIEVPPTQSVEYWHALHDLGVPTSLVIYPDEGHRLRQPAHVKDAAARTVAWFDTYLGVGKP